MTGRDGRSKLEVDKRFVVYVIVLIFVTTVLWVGSHLLTRPRCVEVPKQLNQQVTVDKLYVTTYTFSSDVPVCE